jgi:glutaminase
MSTPIEHYLEKLHAQLASVTEGQVATYIPELAKADPAAFGIAIATVDGCVYEVGNTRDLFTLQSISKPLVYGVALEDRGLDTVRRTVGVEPSGEAFNSISLEAGTGRPMNPMINAGAIATTSLVAGATREDRLARVMNAISAYAGRPLSMDEAVFTSERDTGHRNRAIGHMLRNYEILTDDPESALELYFRQCSVQVHCRDLALMAATLANGGVNPATGERAVQTACVGPILSVMATCGVYDFTGEWIYRVGLPAKSGVGGGIVAVLPGQLGIGVYSPALDERGNSVRGVKACEAISRDLGLHFLQPPRASVSTVRARYTLAQVRSKRRRPEAQARLLAEHGAQVRVYELQGDLRFTTLEPVLRDIVAESQALPALRFAVLDFKRVAHIDDAAARLLADLVSHCANRGQQLVLTRVRRGDALAALDRALDPRAAGALVFQPQLDAGLEWCERALLKSQGIAPSQPQHVPLHEHPVCKGLDRAEIEHLQAQLSRHDYEPGTLLARRGEAADAVHFLVSGEVSVLVGLPGGGQKRLSTLSAGMSFGELGLLSGTPRSADVRADSAVSSYVLNAPALARLEADHPALANRLLRNLLLVTIATAQQLTSEVAALEA